MTTVSTFRVTCPTCRSVFPVDPAKVPEEGVYAACSQCSRVFLVQHSLVEEGVRGDGAPDDTEPPHGEGAVVADPHSTSGVTEHSEGPAGAVSEGQAKRKESVEGEAFDAPPDSKLRSEPDWSPFEDLSSMVEEEDDGAEGTGGGTSPRPGTVPSEAEGVGRGGGQAGPLAFGRQDPHDRARRLARVLVSDMITYNPERHRKALEEGTLQTEFEEEVERSWEEYVEQVGSELAEGTRYFQDALNELLARGRSVY